MMAEEGQQNAITSAFPAPPAFYKSFATDNLSHLQSHLESTTSNPLSIFDPTNPTHGTLPDASTLPTHLQNLVPPLIPAGGTYSTFNTVHNVAPTPESDLPSPPSPDQLIAVLRQVLLQFLKITHILSIDPSMKYYVPAWERLEVLFKEIHLGINTWRPHQAREALIGMMEEQIRVLKSETERCRDGVGKAREIVEGIRKGEGGEKMEVLETNGVNGVDVMNGAKVVTEKERRSRREKEVWQMIENEVEKVG